MMEVFAVDQNPKNQNRCEVCQQSFNSPRELQEHQRTAHQQGQRQQGSTQEQKREKIA